MMMVLVFEGGGGGRGGFAFLWNFFFTWKLRNFQDRKIGETSVWEDDDDGGARCVSRTHGVVLEEQHQNTHEYLLCLGFNIRKK